jgi:cytochrome c-type biogenesis protein CcmH/NrfG
MNRMARHSEAVAALSTAVRLDPSNWQASLNLGASALICF